MAAVALGEFITVNRDELISRCRGKFAARSAAPASGVEDDNGLPLFLDQLISELASPVSNTRAIREGAIHHGRNLFLRGLTVSQVVHDYGDICQSITDLAVELRAPLDTDDFRTMNRCLDDAIAGAVSEYARQQQLAADGHEQGQSLELKNLVFVAITAFEALQGGSVGVTGSTGALVYRSLWAMQRLL